MQFLKIQSCLNNMLIRLVMSVYFVTKRYFQENYPRLSKTLPVTLGSFCTQTTRRLKIAYNYW
jgi:hypothetical protein